MKKVILLTVFAFLFSLGFSFAEVPCKINYQGRLIKDGVPVNGTANMEFKLYTQLTGGTPIKTITLSSVPVYNGLFRTVLDLEGIDWTAGQTIYLEVKVGTDVLSPREEIYAYPYAINTRFLEGKAKDYFINTSVDTQRKDGGLNIMGNVGIGTASPGAKLDVNGRMKVSGAAFTPQTMVIPGGSYIQTTLASPGDWQEDLPRAFFPWTFYKNTYGVTKLHAKLISWLTNTGGKTVTVKMYYQKNDPYITVELASISRTGTGWAKVESPWVDVWSIVGTEEDLAHIGCMMYVTGGGTGAADGATIILRTE